MKSQVTTELIRKMKRNKCMKLLSHQFIKINFINGLNNSVKTRNLLVILKFTNYFDVKGGFQ